MRVLILLAGLVLLFAVAGWITFNNEAGRSSVNLETDEIREDTGQMLHKGSELFENAEQEVAPNTEVDTAPPTVPAQ